MINILPILRHYLILSSLANLRLIRELCGIVHAHFSAILRGQVHVSRGVEQVLRPILKILIVLLKINLLLAYINLVVKLGVGHAI